MLAVKRAAIRGGFWSTAGKRVEKPLMQTLCKLYKVSSNNYRMDAPNVNNQEGFNRGVDFYLLRGDSELKCEVRLMGKGNPESADAVIARDSDVFVADKLSDANKKQLDERGVEWIALRDGDGFRRFGTVLRKLEIPFTDSNFDNIDNCIEEIFNEIFAQ